MRTWEVARRNPQIMRLVLTSICQVGTVIRMELGIATAGLDTVTINAMSRTCHRRLVRLATMTRMHSILRTGQQACDPRPSNCQPDPIPGRIPRTMRQRWMPRQPASS